jgi:hypothetical protein
MSHHSSDPMGDAFYQQMEPTATPAAASTQPMRARFA